MKNIDIVAHRGGYGPYKENTLKKFIHNIRSGTNAFEMDIRYDYWNKRFFLVHGFFHKREWKRNLLKNIVTKIPEDIYLLVELKTNSAFSNIFAKNFKKFYDEYLLGRQVLIASFNPFILMRLRRIAPDIPRAFICGNRLWNFLYHRFFFRFVDASTYIFNKRYLNDKYLKFAKKRGLKLITYLINDKKNWEKALKYDIDGVVTDAPKVIMKLHKSNN